jgi:Fanconi anemia group J protein
VLLVDERYAHGTNDALVRNLPKWLRPATRKCADFDASVAGLRAFFSLKAKHAPPEAARAPPPAKLLPSVGAEKDAKERDGGGGKVGGKPKDSKEAAADARQRDIKRFFQPAAAATDALETRAEVTALSAPAAPAAPPVEQSVRKSPAPVAAPPPRWRSAPVPAVFAPPRPAPDPLVTSQLTDPPSATRTREVTETAPAASPSPGIAKSFRDGCADGHLDENPGFGFASARGLELTEELTEDIFVWGDDAGTVGTSPKKKRKKSHRLRSAATPEDPPTNADPDELSVWGETPGTQGFGARGWGATQQFRNFAPAPDPVPETNAPDPVPETKPDGAEPETEPSPAPARVELPTNAKRRAAETVATTDAFFSAADNRSSSSSEHLPASLLRPRGLGFGRVAVCRACGAKSVSTATALALPDAAEASATPARRVALGTRDGTRDGPAYLAALARANAEENRPVCHRARLFQPGEPFPLRCASAVRVRSPQNSPRNGPVARGDADAPAMPAMPLSPEARGRADLGAWSRADGCYFVPLRCGARWVGARVEATDGAASALVETAAVESDFSASPSGAPQTSKRRAALKPGAAFLLEDALASSAAGREDEDALACLRLARRGEDRAERDERGVEDASREPIENAIEVFEEEDDREDADRENAPDPPGGKPKRRRVRRKASAEAARAALLRERNNGDDAFGS